MRTTVVEEGAAGRAEPAVPAEDAGREATRTAERTRPEGLVVAG
ncbi:hypothetical protein AB0N16_20350 [Streptomyces sp. NPDC051105]